jgi:flagellar motor switch protein FliM
MSEAHAGGRHVAEKLLETPGLSVDRLPMLRAVFERLATSCTESLRRMCGPPTSFFVNKVETAHIWDVLESYESSAAAVYYVPEWDARVLVGVDNRSIMALVEAMFGGDGSEAPPEDFRAFSPLEVRIAHAICDLATESLQASFAPLVDLTFRFERVETRIDFSMMGPRNIPVVAAQVMFQVLDNGGLMYVLIPQTALSPLRQNLERDISLDANADPRWSQQMQKGIRRAEVTLKAVLEEREITLADVAAFRVGQVFELRAKPSSKVTLECREQPFFSCKLGQSDGYYSLVIEDTISETDDFIDDLLAR